MQLPWEMQLFAPAAASGAAPRVAPKLSLELPPELPHHSLPFRPGSGLLVAAGAGLAPGWDGLVASGRLVGRRCCGSARGSGKDPRRHQSGPNGPNQTDGR